MAPPGPPGGVVWPPAASPPLCAGARRSLAARGQLQHLGGRRTTFGFGRGRGLTGRRLSGRVTLAGFARRIRGRHLAFLIGHHARPTAHGPRRGGSRCCHGRSRRRASAFRSGVRRRRAVGPGVRNIAAPTPRGHDPRARHADACQPVDPRSHRAFVLSELPPVVLSTAPPRRSRPLPMSMTHPTVSSLIMPSAPPRWKYLDHESFTNPPAAVFHQQPISSICQVPSCSTPLSAGPAQDMIESCTKLVRIL